MGIVEALNWQPATRICLPDHTLGQVLRSYARLLNAGTCVLHLGYAVVRKVAGCAFQSELRRALGWRLGVTIPVKT